MGEGIVRWKIGDRIVLFPRFHDAAQYGDFTLRRPRPNRVFSHRSVDGRWEFRTNAQGFRDDRDYDRKKPSSELRVLSLGDSHTQGFEVRQEYTFSQVMERALRNRGIDAFVLNTGISGFSTAEQLAFFESRGIEYRPDFVVLGFYANDFEDNLKAGLFQMKDGELLVRKQRHTPGMPILDVVHSVAPLEWLGQHSYLYSLAFNTAWVTAKRALRQRSERAAQLEYAVPVDEDGTGLSAVKEGLAVALLKRLHRVCRAEGIGLIVLDIPRPSEDSAFRSSIPEALVPAFERHSDLLIHSDESLALVSGVAEVHVPHGHRHLSELGHFHLGNEAARAVMTLVAEDGAYGSPDGRTATLSPRSAVERSTRPHSFDRPSGRRNPPLQRETPVP